MEAGSSGIKKGNYWYWVLLIIVSLLAIFFLITFSAEGGEKDELEDYQPERYYNNDEDSNDDSQNNSESNSDFIKKGYLLEEDIKELKHWGLEASELPDLKSSQRIGVINSLAVYKGNEDKGSCDQLLVILKKSPSVKADIKSINEVNSIKIWQSKKFADTADSNSKIIRLVAKN